MTQSILKRLRHLAVAAVIFAALTLGPAGASGMAAEVPGDLSASTKASLPEELLEAVREALRPQTAAALAGPAQPTIQQAKLNAADAEPDDEFGWSVALSGDTAVVGAVFEDPDLGGGPITDAGSAYVFVRSGTTWSLEAKLNAADAEADDRFGGSVAISGDTVVIGAELEEPDLGGGEISPHAGSAYVFVRSGTTWSQQAKLNADDAEFSDLFGGSVAISGDTAVVGARFEDPDLGGGPITMAGSAYVFVRSGTTWSQQAKLNADDAEVIDVLGGSVAISGDTVVIGARLEDPDLGGGPLTDAGSAYVFVRSGTTWSQEAKLVAADAEFEDHFGGSVAISGDTVVIGAVVEDPDLGGGPLTDAGSAYVFVRSGTTWSQQAKLVAGDAEASDFFGFSVALSGDTVVIDARLEDPDLGGGPLTNAGSAYVFVRSGAAWSQEAKLNAADAEEDDRFGLSVALSSDTAVVGARFEDPDLGGGPITDAGSAYVFVRSGTTWSQEAKLNAAEEAEMDVQGDGSSITDGDTTPSTADHTDFGSAAVEGGSVTRTFTIQNTGGTDLNLNDNPRVTIGGTHAADFTLTSDADTPVTGGGQTTFQVTLDPSALRLRQATISIANNDADENPYDFSIQGIGTTSIFLPLIARDFCSDFFDDFSDPATGWEIIDDAFIKTEYIGGEYRVLTKQSGFTYLIPAPTCGQVKYVVETDVRWVDEPGAEYGIVFGIVGNFDSFNLLRVNAASQQYRTFWQAPGGGSCAGPLTDSAAINPGNSSNHLKVTVSNSIVLEINGVEVPSSCFRTNANPTFFGIASGPFFDLPVSDARFDNFSVSRLPITGAGPEAFSDERQNRLAVEGPAHYRAEPANEIDWGLAE